MEGMIKGLQNLFWINHQKIIYYIYKYLREKIMFKLNTKIILILLPFLIFACSSSPDVMDTAIDKQKEMDAQYKQAQAESKAKADADAKAKAEADAKAKTDAKAKA